MNLKLQTKLMKNIIGDKKKIDKKEKWIKILDSNFITRFLFYYEIRILELEIIQLHLKQISNGIKGLIDCDTSQNIK